VNGARAVRMDGSDMSCHTVALIAHVLWSFVARTKSRRITKISRE